MSSLESGACRDELRATQPELGQPSVAAGPPRRRLARVACGGDRQRGVRLRLRPTSPKETVARIAGPHFHTTARPGSRPRGLRAVWRETSFRADFPRSFALPVERNHAETPETLPFPEPFTHSTWTLPAAPSWPDVEAGNKPGLNFAHLSGTPHTSVSGPSFWNSWAATNVLWLQRLGSLSTSPPQTTDTEI